MNATQKITLYEHITLHKPELTYLLKEWAEPNLTPHDVTRGSSRKVWWKCLKHSTYQQTINAKINQSQGCPYCAGKILSGVNDFKTLYPEIARQQSPNCQIDLSQTGKSSSKKVLWLCEEHGEYKRQINSRVQYNSGCPICLGIPPKNTTIKEYLTYYKPNHVHLLEEWDSKNIQTPSLAIFKSKEKYYWKCLKHGTYQQTIACRTQQESGCQTCGQENRNQSNRKRAIPKYRNSLQAQYPEIAQEMIIENITPKEVSPYSQQTAIWKCNQKHYWSSSIAARVSKKLGCAYCANKKLLTGYNDLETFFPEIAAQWHPDNKINPNQVLKGSTVKRKWLCQNCNGSWEAEVRRRTGSNKRGCPYCSNNKILVGYNDIATTHPEIAKELSPNEPRCSTTFSFASTYKALFICEFGHEYKAMVSNRTKTEKPSGCRICAKQWSKSEKLIADTLRNKIKAKVEHQPTKHGTNQPDIVVKSNNKKIVIEFDGWYWHKGKEKHQRDTKQTINHLEHYDAVIRIRNKQLKEIKEAINIMHTHIIEISKKEEWLEEITNKIITELTNITEIGIIKDNYGS